MVGNSARLTGIALSLMLGIGLGCASSSQPKLDSRVPLDRAKAAVAAAEQGEPDAIYALVELLDDQDGAVRMYAILALRRLTGHTYGYVYHGTLTEREAAIDRWRTALQEGTVRLAEQPDPDRSDSHLSTEGR